VVKRYRFTDLNGNVIGWSSAGKVGFKGSRNDQGAEREMQESLVKDALSLSLANG